MWAKNFWNKHGERLVFAAFALGMSAGMWLWLDLKPEAKTIIVGIAMLFFNKVRGNGVSQPPAQPPAPAPPQTPPEETLKKEVESAAGAAQ